MQKRKALYINLQGFFMHDLFIEYLYPSINHSNALCKA